MMKKVSCVMSTFRRFSCVERSIAFFLSQDYKGESELIIFNTDTEYPLSLSQELSLEKIVIINNNTDYISGENYSNIGSIRRDALSHASGEYYICWDDDDIFLPWNIRQCVDGIERNPEMWAWKPKRSMFWQQNKKPELAENVMEASVISLTEKIKEIGFLPHLGGGEHLSWVFKLKDEKKIIVDENSIPGYCFNWHDQGVMRGHKQSGTINREDNFSFHKENTKDFAKKKLRAFPKKELTEIYNAHIEVIKRECSDKKEILQLYIK